MLLDYSIVGLFFLVIFLIGVADRKNLTIEDYWVNGRKTNKFVLVATVLSTFVGAETILGGAGLAYAGGGLAIFAAVASYVLYFFIFARFFAGRIKEFGDRHHAFTLPDFLEVRFSKRVRLAGAIVNLVTWVLFLAAQILAMGVFTALLIGIDPTTGTIVGALIVIAYTAIGGLRADIRTDIFQCCVMLVLLLLFLPLIVLRGGGFSGLARLPVSFLMGSAFAPPYVYALMFLFLGTGVFASADVWQRVYAADTPRNARWAMGVAGALLILFFIMAILFGVFGKALLPDADSNTVVPALMKLLLPPGLFGLVLAGFFAAILSTVDTVLLLTSMTLVHDFYQKSLKRELAPDAVLRLSRWVTLCTGLVGLTVALIVFDIVHLAIESVSFYIVLSPAVIFGFYSRRQANGAAFWSIVLGFIATFAFLFVDPVQAFIPGLLVSFLTYVVIWAFGRRLADPAMR